MTKYFNINQEANAWLGPSQWSVKSPVKPRAKKRTYVKHEMQVQQLDLKGNVIGEWDSPSEAHKGTGVEESNIIRVVEGKRMTAGGFKWKAK